MTHVNVKHSCLNPLRPSPSRLPAGVKPFTASSGLCRHHRPRDCRLTSSVVDNSSTTAEVSSAPTTKKGPRRRATVARQRKSPLDVATELKRRIEAATIREDADGEKYIEKGGLGEGERQWYALQVTDTKETAYVRYLETRLRRVPDLAAEAQIETWVPLKTVPAWNETAGKVTKQRRSYAAGGWVLIKCALTNELIELMSQTMFFQGWQHTLTWTYDFMPEEPVNLIQPVPEAILEDIKDWEVREEPVGGPQRGTPAPARDPNAVDQETDLADAFKALSEEAQETVRNMMPGEFQIGQAVVNKRTKGRDEPAAAAGAVVEDTGAAVTEEADASVKRTTKKRVKPPTAEQLAQQERREAWRADYNLMFGKAAAAVPAIGEPASPSPAPAPAAAPLGSITPQWSALLQGVDYRRLASGLAAGAAAATARGAPKVSRDGRDQLVDMGDFITRPGGGARYDEWAIADDGARRNGGRRGLQQRGRGRGREDGDRWRDWRHEQRSMGSTAVHPPAVWGADDNGYVPPTGPDASALGPAANDWGPIRGGGQERGWAAAQRAARDAQDDWSSDGGRQYGSTTGGRSMSSWGDEGSWGALGGSAARGTDPAAWPASDEGLYGPGLSGTGDAREGDWSRQGSGAATDGYEDFKALDGGYVGANAGIDGDLGWSDFDTSGGLGMQPEQQGSWPQFDDQVGAGDSDTWPIGSGAQPGGSVADAPGGFGQRRGAWGSDTVADGWGGEGGPTWDEPDTRVGAGREDDRWATGRQAAGRGAARQR